MSAFDLPELPYAYDALDPYMSAETLEYHHDKHHLAYVDNGNKIIAGLSNMGETLEEVVVNAHKQGEQGLFNNAGQHYNHKHFWNWMKPNGGGEAGLTQFGSGWAWLVLDANGKLDIAKTANADNPLTSGHTPILGCDVWEHSYYIDYRNARPKYLEAFVDNLVNWEYCAELYGNGPLKLAA